MKVLKDLFTIGVETTVVLRQIERATGKVVSETKPQKNLVFDGGLNALARSTNATYPAEFTLACRVGDGTTADKVASGAITFTQVGTTITASAPFFTAGMAGWIFKYGTGTAGAEYYITAYTDSTHVTVDTSATVAVPEVATVWNVARTTLANLLYTSTTYETTAGSCQTTSTGNTMTHKRTYNFAQQVSSYNVNEVGYFRASAGTTVFGRVILGATVVVAPTNFLQVVLSVTFTYSPSAPTAVADVGTNINTAGNAMLEQFSSGSWGTVNSGTGAATAAGAGNSADGSANGGIYGIIASYTQNASVGSTALTVTKLTFNNSQAWTYAAARGKMTLSCNTTISTAGQTLYGVMIGRNGNNEPLFDIKFTATYALPTGSFLPQVVFSQTYNRVLNN